ncbi:PREDICTED: protein FAR1-RELATED SEQUENCE 5-like [Nelumbo nucifera]|uniref:Protein FAR1-RELATED SEQUENCE 5-like n=1 Tax=Nelumbo nucifera TaxID=4432 RepID=A0A1U8Q6R7_NELNU|nr:PREDICTED: protein FAR1-RELATED SEQUENCE 5-like [Nelumbo nucifera]
MDVKRDRLQSLQGPFEQAKCRCVNYHTEHVVGERIIKDKMEVGSHSMRKLSFELNGEKDQHNDINEPSKPIELDKEKPIVDSSPKTQEEKGLDLRIQNKFEDKLTPVPGDWIPKVGMMFKTDEEAYEFYNRYAGMVGFSARKGSSATCSKTHEVRYRKFCCSKEGKRLQDKRRPIVKKPRAETRCGCMAEMKISRRKDGWFHVVAFNETHNHMIVTPKKVHMPKSQRKVNEPQGTQVTIADDSNIAPKESMELMTNEASGHENIGFTPVDQKNYLHSNRTRKVKKGEVGNVLQYFEVKQLEDPSFIYAIQLDQNDIVTNLFWADAQMIVDYGHFGDVICFDTTYRTNQENRPFVLFVGVNNYKQIIIFGAALLYDESIDTFEWLFKVFIKTMGGKKPKTILTDDDAAMVNAINSVFSESHHQLCIWHMYQNATKYLNSVFEKFKTFPKDFSSCVYDCEDVDEFENVWKSMINRYGLKENEWLQKLYDKRYRWALAFGRQTFSADMSTAQRSDRMNSCLKKYLNMKHTLSRFLQHFERVVADRRYEELKVEYATTQSTPALATQLGTLNYIAQIYTPPVLSIFNDEVLKQLSCSIEEDHIVSETTTEYIVNMFGVNRQYKVTFDTINDLISCSCKKFEFVGILCGHALKILDYRRIKLIPSCYILRRWTINARMITFEESHGSTQHFDANTKMAIRRREMFHMLSQIVNRAACNQDTYKIVMKYGEKLFEDVSTCLKQTTFGQSLFPSENMEVENENSSSPCIDGICKYGESSSNMV